MSGAVESNEQPQSEIQHLRRRLRESEQRRQRAEAALKAIEKRNRLLADSAPFGIFVVDTAGRITGHNRRFAQMLQWPVPEGLPDMNIFEHPAFKNEGVAKDFLRCIEKKKPVVKAYPCVTAGGDCLHMRFSLCPVADGDGTITEVLTFVEDISDLKQAEVEIRESEERYRLLFRSTPVALIERDASRLKAYIEELRQSGVRDFNAYLREHPQAAAHCMAMIRTVDFNDAVVRLFEADDRSELKQGLMPIPPSEVSRFARDIILMIAEGNISQEREESFLTLKGNQRSILVKSLIVSGHEDTYARIVISLVDISKRKETEEPFGPANRNSAHRPCATP